MNKEDFFTEFLQDMLYVCRKAQYYYDTTEREYSDLEFKEKYKLKEEGDNIEEKRKGILEKMNEIGVVKFTLFNAYQELQDLQKDPYKNQKEN